MNIEGDAFGKIIGTAKQGTRSGITHQEQLSSFSPSASGSQANPQGVDGVELKEKTFLAYG